MARTIRLTRVNQTTKVEVFESGILTHEIASNNDKDFINDETGFIRFPEDTLLDQLNLSVSTLHADTVTLLGSPTTATALFAALLTNKIFNTEVV